ncbi:uncharacterized protein ASPGLDRAFT_43584 [Aspergillus glaucus CBS 516.65]|uniref:Uncharacterized protein n=1 Tax=Aspergillus glaucus CBS 516.65 TaxID=1160497 RepID=A0A1L9VT63_ASPGL|nr:hypothetical protein ASPGLDRAFT_43584 [Aspergillus glaucus CBS 516.65]OJJ87099.1 hypothetical protein ASPGLDRAFT_43584 [Aspergillus glaucus CBS 516.65]
MAQRQKKGRISDDHKCIVLEQFKQSRNMDFTLVALQKLQAEIGKEVKVIAHNRGTKNLTVTKIMMRARPESIFLCHASYQRRSNVRSSGFKQMSSRAELFWLCPSRILRLMAPVLGRFWKLSRSATKRRVMVSRSMDAL